MVNIYLIRHGQTELNVKNMISGQVETNLTPLGRQQALDTALKLREEGIIFDVILSSPLQRAKDTAEIISSVIKAPLVFDSDLMEFNNGDYEGTSVEDLKQKHFNPSYKINGLEFDNGADMVAAYSSFDSKYDVFAYPNGETKIQARDRFMGAVRKYLQTHREVENLAVVAHGGVIRFMILKISPQSIEEKIKNAEVKLVRYDRDKNCFMI